jgi:hypothetical protein
MEKSENEFSPFPISYAVRTLQRTDLGSAYAVPLLLARPGDLWRYSLIGGGLLRTKSELISLIYKILIDERD